MMNVCRIWAVMSTCSCQWASDENSHHSAGRNLLTHRNTLRWIGKEVKVDQTTKNQDGTWKWTPGSSEIPSLETIMFRFQPLIFPGCIRIGSLKKRQLGTIHEKVTFGKATIDQETSILPAGQVSPGSTGSVNNVAMHIIELPNSKEVDIISSKVNKPKTKWLRKFWNFDF